jgi:EAL and modified HD-GYP domain-containing signal transduction protein
MHEKFIARQPILDTRLQVFAYELLFRGGPQNSFQPFANAASSVIADSITLFDLEMLAGQARAFVNVDEMALRLGAPRLLPADRIVVEILETVRPTQEILGACRELCSAGYQLALDDFVDSPEIAPLVEFASFLKIDFQMFDARTRSALARKYKDSNIRLLAEKVETESEFREARDLGFSYFQGYFFCKPSMVETREIPGNKATQLQLLTAVAAPEFRFDIIENLLKQEPSLLYRLLRYLNSPILGLRSEVRSVRHAIVLLGQNEFRRWASIFAIISMSAGKSPELIRTALIRAFFCEELAAAAGLREKGSSLFLMGLLSVTDALLDKPMRDVLKALPVIQDVKIALCGGTNRFREVFELVLALEHAEWIRISDIAERIGCDEGKVADSYLSALLRATSIGA